MVRSSAAAVAVVLVCVGARAGACPDSVPSRAALVREAARARIYDTGWAVGFGAIAIATAATAELAGSDLATERRDGLWIAAGQATIAALSHLVLPLRVERPPAATGDACTDAAAIDRAAATTAHRETVALWLSILGGATLISGGVLYLGLHDHVWSDAALSGAVGVSVAVAHAWTLVDVHVEVTRVAGVTALGVAGAF